VPPGGVVPPVPVMTTSAQFLQDQGAAALEACACITRAMRHDSTDNRRTKAWQGSTHLLLN
jgi:hypothetical protein